MESVASNAPPTDCQGKPSSRRDELGRHARVSAHAQIMYTEFTVDRCLLVDQSSFALPRSLHVSIVNFFWCEEGYWDLQPQCFFFFFFFSRTGALSVEP